MANANVGRVTAEFVGDASQLIREAQKAEKAVQKYAQTAAAASAKAQSVLAPSTQYMGVQAQINGATTAAQRYAQAMSSLTPIAGKSTRSIQELGAQASKAGRLLSTAVTLPLIGAGVAAVKTANDFEFAMTSIVGLVGVAADEVKAMEDDVRSMAQQFGKSGGEAARALFFITSAGLRGADATQVLEQSLKASAIGLGDTATIADLATSALNAYGSSVLSASDATDVMVATVREGKLQADELAGSMGRVLPLASAMGVSFNEVGAAFAALSRTGTQASEAATQIRGILSSLLNPAKQAEEKLTELGLSSSGLRKSIREDGLLATLQILADTFGDNEEAAGVVFGNIRALSGVLDLMGANVETTTAIFGSLENVVGDTNEAFDVMAETGAFKTQQAMAQLKEAFLALGQTIVPIIVPAVTAVANAFRSVATFISDLPGPIKTVLVVMGGIAAATGPMLLAFGAIAKSIDKIKAAAMALFSANPIVLGLAAAATVAAAAWYAYSRDAKAARERQERLTDALRTAGEPTVTLTDKVRALVDEYVRLQSEAPGTEQSIEAGAQAFVSAEIAGTKAAEAFKSVGFTVADLTDAVSGGTDAYDDLSSRLYAVPRDVQVGSSAMKNFAHAVAQTLDETDPLRQGLLDLAASGQYSYRELHNIVEILDETADAFDDSREAINAENEALLKAGDTAAYFGSVLGQDVYQSIIDTSLATAEAAGRSDSWTYALENVNDALKAHNDAADRAEYYESRLRAATSPLTREARTAEVQFEKLADALANAARSGEDGKVTFESMADKLGILNEVMANELALALLDAQEKSAGLYETFADLEAGSFGVEKAVREQLNAMVSLITEAANLKGGVNDVLPTLKVMYDDLLNAADAADIDRSAILALIEQIGILDGLEPDVRIALGLNTEELASQIAAIKQQITELRGDAATRNSPALRELMSMLDTLEAVASAVGTARTRPSVGGGRGGGGGRAEDPFAWVEDWVKDLADYTAVLFDEDFADRLVEMSADDVAKAIRDVIEEGIKLGIPLLEGGGAALNLVQVLGDQLANAANQLGGPGGLQERFEAASDKVKEFERNLADLEERFREFQRIERGIGEPTTLQRLDEQLSILGDLKGSVAALKAEYEEFKGAGGSAIDAQLGKLMDLGSVLSDLEAQYADFNRQAGAISPLEKERGVLDDLRNSFEQLKQARVSYTQQTAQSLSSFQLAGRGGAMFLAKRYLAKAESFRDIVTQLRDRAFPGSIIREVIAAGIDGGTAIGRKLLALSDADLAEFKRIQEQIGAVAAQTSEIAADVLFTADTKEAQAAFDRQMSLVQQMYQQAIAQARNEFEQQQALVAGVYEQQIAQAEMALEQQKVVVEGLFQSALAEAKANLQEAKDAAQILKTAIDDLKDAMYDLIKQIADAINAATKTQEPSGGGVSSGSGTVPTGDFTSSGLPIVRGIGDTGTPTPGQFVGGEDRLWGGPGGGGVVEGIYIPPGINWAALSGRAAGGPVMAGKPYVVGEIGPELFVPRSDGTIIPNGATVGAGSRNYTINVNIAGGQNIGREVVRAIEEYERRNGTGWRS